MLRFEGAYHGAHDVGVTSMFPTELRDFPECEPSCDGLVEPNQGRVLVAPFNDLETTSLVFEQHASELGAVIVEPLQRCLPPTKGFLEGLRELATKYQVPLIFDEVVTGFRLAFGGAQERYGVVPDLVAYGKALGGGFPIGVFAGRRDLMDLAREARAGLDTYVWTASTLGGNPISTTAALAVLSVMREPGVYEKLFALGEYLRSGMLRVLDELGIEAKVLGEGPLAQVAFTRDEPTNYRTSQHYDKPAARELMLSLFEKEIFLNPMGTKLYLSLAHSEQICDEFLNRFRDSLQETFIEKQLLHS